MKTNEKDKLISMINSDNATEDDIAFQTARMYAEEALNNPDFASELHERKMEWLHTKGWSGRKDFKSNMYVPFDVVYSLPKWLQNDKKKLFAWLRDNMAIFDLSK